MTTTANLFNVETSLNSWFITQVASFSPPSPFGSFASTRVRTDMPETPLNTPCYTVHHLPISMKDAYMGRIGYDSTSAMDYSAFMDISVWVSRSNLNWLFQQRWMGHKLTDLVISTKQVQISDYLTDVNNPTSTQERILLGTVEARQVLEDMNPDIERARYLIRYETILRS